MSVDDIKIILDKLKELSFTRVHLLGGEPLMAPNLKYIVSYARKLGIEVTMVTNGTLLTEQLFNELYDLGVKSISFSMDGTSCESNDLIRGKGAFNRTVENIKRANEIRKNKAREIYLYLSFTLTRANIKSYDLLEFAEKLGIDSVSISYLSNEGEARKNYNNLELTQDEKMEFIDKIISDYKNHKKVSLHIDSRSWLVEYIYKKHGHRLVTDNLGCKGGDRQLYILANGQLLPCSPAGTSIGKKLKGIILEEFPNLLYDTVEDIEKSKSHIFFYNYTRSNKTYEAIKPCSNCKYTCKACPLLYDAKNVVEECVVAQRRIKELDQYNLEYSYKKRDMLRISEHEDRIEIINFIKSEYI